jgi:hypothetical protein
MTSSPSLLKRHLVEAHSLGRNSEDGDPTRPFQGYERWVNVSTSWVRLNGPRPHSTLAFKFSIFCKGIKTKKGAKSVLTDPNSGTRPTEVQRPVCRGLDVTSRQTELGEKT